MEVAHLNQKQLAAHWSISEATLRASQISGVLNVRTPGCCADLHPTGAGQGPPIVAAILDDRLPNHITLFDLAVDPPALWDEQRAWVGLRDGYS